MGTTLDNGIYLPDEGERNCYEGLAGNWVALDNHLGSTNIHVTINDKQAWNGHVADSVKHVTAEDKAAWNGKADASALTAHTGDTTIHVTAEDKAKWDAVTSKADDSDVMHLSGNESASGDKNFKGLITTKSDLPLWTVNTNTTADITSLAPTCIHVESKPAGSLTDLSGGAWYVAQIGTGCFFFRHNSGIDIRYKHFPTNAVSKICVMSNDNKFISDLIPDTTNAYNLGDSNFKWKTFNGLNPSSLGMPDLNNGIDISSYISYGANRYDSTYTVPANGYIAIYGTCGGTASGMVITNGNYTQSSYAVRRPDLVYYAGVTLPVLAGDVVTISTNNVTSLISAKFYPCQGNV